MSDARSDILLFFFLTRCVTAFAMDTYLFLLIRNGFTFTFTGTGILFGALTAYRQTFTMSQTSVAAEIHQTFDINADFATQFTLNDIRTVDNFTDFGNFLFAQILNAAVAVNTRFCTNILGSFSSDTKI